MPDVPDEPTTRELLIRIEALTAQIASLITRLDGLTNSYVPRGEYVEAVKAITQRQDAQERQQDKFSGMMRTIGGGVAVATIMLIIGAIFTLAQKGAGL